MPDTPRTKAATRTAASGRFDVYQEPEPGAGSWVHRWLGDDFPHKHGAGAECPCQPYYIGPNDPRSLDEIADDIEEAESGNDA